jgi:hypothetical protein
MGWHDSTIYGMALKNYDDFLLAEIVFDIDYLFKWIHPEPPEQSFSFWISPCTLVFKRVFNHRSSYCAAFDLVTSEGIHFTFLTIEL